MIWGLKELQFFFLLIVNKIHKPDLQNVFRGKGIAKE